MKLITFVFGFILASSVATAQTAIDSNYVNLKRNAGSKEAYRKAIRDNVPLLKTCYKLSSKKIGNDRSITLEWQVDDMGAVRYSKIKRSNIDNLTVESCIKDKIKEIEFPAAPSRQLINITYLVELK